jgi:hypothetical protein
VLEGHKPSIPPIRVPHEHLKVVSRPGRAKDPTEAGSVRTGEHPIQLDVLSLLHARSVTIALTALERAVRTAHLLRACSSNMPV